MSTAPLQHLAMALSTSGLSTTFLEDPVRLRVQHPSMNVVGLTVMAEPADSRGPWALRLSSGPLVLADDIPKAADVITSEISRYVKLPEDDLAAEDRSVTLADLRLRFPGTPVWLGNRTGACWAMTRDRNGRHQLIEASDPVELNRRLEAIGARTGSSRASRSLPTGVPTPTPTSHPKRFGLSSASAVNQVRSNQTNGQ